MSFGPGEPVVPNKETPDTLLLILSQDADVEYDVSVPVV